MALIKAELKSQGLSYAELAKERRELGRHLVENEPRVRVARAEAGQVDGRHAVPRGEGRQVPPPPPAGAGEPVQEDDLRPGLTGLQRHDRTVSAHDVGASPRRA